MDRQYKNILRQNGPRLVQELDMSEKLLRILLARRAITEAHIAEIQEKTGKERQIGTMIDLLVRKVMRGLPALVEALNDTGQGDLAALLDPGNKIVPAKPASQPDPPLQPDDIRQLACGSLTYIDYGLMKKVTLDDPSIAALLKSTVHVYPLNQPVKGRALFLDQDKLNDTTLKELDIQDADSLGFSPIDNANVGQLLDNLGYKSSTVNNLNQKQLKSCLEEEVEHLNKGGVDSFVLIMIAAGSPDGKHLILEDGHRITTDEILSYFQGDKCRGLRGKPKLFIFHSHLVTTSAASPLQADNVDYGMATDGAGDNLPKEVFDGEGKGLGDASKNFHDTMDAQPRPPRQEKIVHPKGDWYKVHATTAVREEERLKVPWLGNGSIFIKVLCHVFAKYSHKESVLDMIYRVHGLLSDIDKEFCQGKKVLSLTKEDTMDKKMFLFPGITGRDS